jgi:glutamine synthetase
LRVPVSGASARRIENRLAGADANPYLAMAASLICGYLGMIERLKPANQIEGSAYRMAHTLPKTAYEALQKFMACRPIKPLLGEKFMNALRVVKTAELEAYQNVINNSLQKTEPCPRALANGPMPVSRHPLKAAIRR